MTYVFSGLTVYLIYGYLSEGDGRMDKAWDIVRRDFFDILTLAAASTAVNMLKSAAQRKPSAAMSAATRAEVEHLHHAGVANLRLGLSVHDAAARLDDGDGSVRTALHDAGT